MDTARIHTELFLLFDAIESAERTFKNKDSSSISALYRLLTDTCESHAILGIAIIQGNETFCRACFYKSMDSVRKALYRYIMIENDAGDIDILIKANDVFNRICLSLKEYKGAECCETKNDAFGKFHRE